MRDLDGLVAHLRADARKYDVALSREAADEIVRLRAERDEWRQAQKEAVESRERWHELYLAEGDRAKSLEAECDRLRDALRNIDSHIYNDNGDVTFAPLQIKAIIDAALKGDTQ